MAIYLPRYFGVVVNATPASRKTDVFQQEGAPTHIHSKVTTFWNTQLPEQCIG
jgi:hypothetical protein